MQVAPGSAAARAGIQGGNQRVYYGNYEILIGGDLIVEIDGQPITDLQDLTHIMNNHRSGDTVTIVFYHGKKKVDRAGATRRSQKRRPDLDGVAPTNIGPRWIRGPSELRVSFAHLTRGFARMNGPR